MKVLVLYHTTFGATKQYADWIAEDLGADAIPNGRFREADLEHCDTVIIGSNVMMGRLGISGWLTANWPILKSRRIILFSVSGTDPGRTEEIDRIISASITPAIRSAVTYVPLHGRFSVSSLPRLIRSVLTFIRNMEHDERKKATMFPEFDGVKRENILPLVAAARRKRS